MIGIRFLIQGLTQFLNRLKLMQDTKRMLPLAEASARRLEKIFREATPTANPRDFDPRRGALKAAWKGSAAVLPQSRVAVDIVNLDPRARQIWPLLVKGTSAHPIHARSARYLVFQQRDRSMFVGKKVSHPGFQPKVDTRRLVAQVNTETARLKKAIITLYTSGKSTP
jgi:hypothetical protein